MSRIPFESTNDALALSDLDIKPDNARLSATTGSGAPSCSISRQQTLIQEAEDVPEAMSEAQFKCYSNEFYIPTGLHYTNSTSLCNRNQNLIPEVSDSLRQDHRQLLQAMHSECQPKLAAAPSNYSVSCPLNPRTTTEDTNDNTAHIAATTTAVLDGECPPSQINLTPDLLYAHPTEARNMAAHPFVANHKEIGTTNQYENNSYLFNLTDQPLPRITAETCHQTTLDGDSNSNSKEASNSKSIGNAAVANESKNTGYEFLPWRYHGKYHDHVTYPVTFEKRKRRDGPGGITVLFPRRLQLMLDCAEKYKYADIVSWLPHGRAFKIHDRTRFVTEVVPKFFKQSTFCSFARQLRMYGFERLQGNGRSGNFQHQRHSVQQQMLSSSSPDRGAYFHEGCLRGMPSLCLNIQKLEKRTYNDINNVVLLVEPDFYSMPPAPSINTNPTTQEFIANEGD